MTLPQITVNGNCVVTERNHYYIDGEWRPSSGEVIQVINPTTEEIFGSVRATTPDEVDAAVRSADRAMREGPWPEMTLEQRCQIITRIKEGLVARKEELAYLTASTLGAPRARAASIGGAPGLIDMYLDTINQVKFEYVRDDKTGRSLITRKPVGVVAGICPWNTPLRTEVKKAIPAILTGCTVVLKSAPETPFNGAVFAEVATQAGLPPGVLNLVFGAGRTGTALVTHPLVRMVAFTGSAATGAKIGAHCGETFKRLQLEQGGKSAAIILEDADLDTTLKHLDEGNFRGTGQICIGLTRIYAPRSRYDEVVNGLVERANGHVVGDPKDPAVDVGPLVTKTHYERVMRYIDLGKTEGARVAAGGGRPAHLPKGWFVEPTVFADVRNEMAIAREEIFGPVASVIAYEKEAEALAMANDSPYGLHGAVFSRDSDHALELARQLDTGNVGINCFGTTLYAPFGGVKHSGIGREQGPEGYDGFLEYVPYTLSLA